MSFSLFTADDTWALWTILIVFAAFSLYAEQHWKWAERLSGPMLGVLLAIIAVNLKIIPADAPVYDAVWTYCIPLGVSMLLFRARMRDLVKDTGKMFLCFNLTAVGAFLGGIIAFFAKLSLWICAARYIFPNNRSVSRSAFRKASLMSSAFSFSPMAKPIGYFVQASKTTSNVNRLV